MSARWTPGIGDPSLLGWLTVAAYLAAAALCLRAGEAGRALRRDRKRGGHLERPFWLALSVGFLLLGINKQLDLQSLLTQTMRDLARAQGWYAERRAYQALFIQAVAGTGVALSLAAIWMLRRTNVAVKVALVGLSFTLAFVIVRAASFHRIDLFLGGSVAGLRWNWVIELTGIGVVAVAARRYDNRRSQRAR